MSEANKPVPQDPHLCDAQAAMLHKEGHTLTKVATALFGFVAVDSQDENYLYNPVTQSYLAIMKKKDDMEVAVFPMGINGRTQCNVVRFVMDHASGEVKSPLAAIDYVRDRMAKYKAAQPQ